MNTMLSKPAWSACVLMMLASASIQASDDLTAVERAKLCAQESARLERLNCYDAVFQQPETADEANQFTDLWYAIEEQENARDDDNVGLIVQESADNVLMSVPALGTTPPRPVLVIACDKQITRFQLHLPTPLNRNRVDIHFQSEVGSAQEQWRLRDGGHVVSGGRGLPAIATLRSLLNASEVTVRSDEATLNNLRFDMTGLRQTIKPLREACRW